MADQGDADRLREIVRRLRSDHGVEVLEVTGCYSRGLTWTRTPGGIVDHHDASSRKAGEWGALGIIRDGRTGIPGPLSQFQIARCLDGRPRLAAVAAGRANHAGVGGPMGAIPTNSGNSWLYGAECANDGLGEPYTAAAHHAHDALFRVVADVCGFPVARIVGHKEWAPGRKSDPVYSMSWRRARVADLRPAAPAPAPAPVTPTRKAENMIETIEIPAGTGGRRLPLPVGEAVSRIVAAAWMSVTVNGPSAGSVRVFFQSDTGGISDTTLRPAFADGRSSRPWVEVPKGTTQIVLQWDMPQGGAITIEMLSR